MNGISKRYPGTLAVGGVDFAVCAGEVHALIGKNGAGKSTLMKILAGAFADYTGSILVGGREAALHSPSLSRSGSLSRRGGARALGRPLPNPPAPFPKRAGGVDGAGNDHTLYSPLPGGAPAHPFGFGERG
ncbi:MAG: ATP-binding cassette domain-containing protein [Armatimonadetes bacterium]|nr:ATP-binding cassette domain-containing protein [Armatimonadota bacterium]